MPAETRLQQQYETHTGFVSKANDSMITLASPAVVGPKSLFRIQPHRQSTLEGIGNAAKSGENETHRRDSFTERCRS
jgi:hypothetical protein